MRSLVFRRFQLILWPIILFLLWWAVRSIPLESVIEALSALRFYQIGMLILFNTTILFLFSSRWWFIIRAMGFSVSYISLFGYRLAAFGISYFTPGAQFGGEPLQVYLLQQRHHLPGATALATVTLDKIFELLANFTFLTVGFFLILNGGLVVQLASWWTILVIGGILSLPLLYCLALLAGWFPASRLVVRLPARVNDLPLPKRLLPVIVATERSIGALFRQRPKVVLWLLLLSGIIWVLLLVEYWLMLAFLDVQFTLIQAIIALTAARVAFLTPIPGGLVALEAGQIFILQVLGVDPAVGVSASLLIRARDLTFGAFGLWWAGMLSRSGAPKSLLPRTGQ